MNWFSKILKAKTLSQPISTNKKYTNEYFEGLDAFKIGRKLYSDSVSDHSLSKERKEQKKIAALEFFDKAKEKGYDDADMFSFRGICLRDLGFWIDALEDLNTSIEKDPERASFYYDRAITKQYIYDFEGSLNDFNEGIPLSKIDNAYTREWNEFARKAGYVSATQICEYDLDWLMRYQKLSENSPTMQRIIKDEKADIKRRFQ